MRIRSSTSLWLAAGLAGVLLAFAPPGDARARPKRSADVIIKSVEVKMTKEILTPWDTGTEANRPPDLYVEIAVLGAGDTKPFRTAVKEDTFTAKFDVKTVRVTESDVLKIAVYDKDLKSNDVVGKYTKKITTDTPRERTVNWSFDQVTALALEFQP